MVKEYLGLYYIKGHIRHLVAIIDTKIFNESTAGFFMLPFDYQLVQMDGSLAQKILFGMGGYLCCPSILKLLHYIQTEGEIL